MSTIFDSGRHHIGFNYWGSHAGTDMWRDWQEDVIRDDVRRLSEAGATVLRVFPMWKDFQPIAMLRKGNGVEKCVYFREQPLGHDALGKAGLDPIMMERFDCLIRICREYKVQLIVGLLTGWMSGRLFVPEALQGRDVITDPFCLYWEKKFIEGFIPYFKNNDTIVAWELGNECNCMGVAENSHQAWLWTHTIASAIRRFDPSRPVLSGMHSLTPNGEWTIQHQGEECDILTIHPYPVFTPYCNLDPHNTIKPVVHLGAELCFCREIGGKPCFTEEIGTTDMRIDEENNSDFVRTNLFNALAYDGFPFLWWCGAYEKDLNHAPYSWGHGERGMGMIIPGGGNKPALNEFTKFKKLCDALPFECLPARRVQAHSILSAADSWGAHLGSFLLSLQNAFSITCQTNDQALKQADFYLCPSYEISTKAEWEEMQSRVRNGASLYVSSNNYLGTDYDVMFGFKFNLIWGQPQTYLYKGKPITSSFSKKITVTTGEVLLQDDNGNPLLIRNRYGKGVTYYCPVAIEMDYAQKSAVAYTDAGELHRTIYSILAEDMQISVRKTAYLTGITEHWFDETHAALVLVNYDTKAVEEKLTLREGFALKNTEGVLLPPAEDGAVHLRIEKNDGCILLMEKE